MFVWSIQPTNQPNNFVFVQPYSRSTEKESQTDNDNDQNNDHDDDDVIGLMDPILVDFGIAKEANSMIPTRNTTTGIQGTQNYIDPALLSGKLKRATTASDVWAFGG